MPTLNRFTVSALTAGTLIASSLIVSQPVQAFTFNSGKKSVTISSSDIGNSFTAEFDGNVNGTPTPGLTAEAVFTFLGFNTPFAGVTQAFFNVVLSNTSTAQSRVSALGFNSSVPLRGVGNDSGPGNTRVFGVFGNDRSGSFPNQFGDIGVCFTNGNTCQGNGNGGVANGNIGEFNPVLAFDGSINSFTLDNFGVRYQAVAGVSQGNSGTGVGLVPTPALLPGLIGMCVAALRKKQEGEVAEEV